jgi:2-polyprenyl-3-methyl-5-hydroxy-6-metoxy-1,4-benzoquinol methylase
MARGGTNARLGDMTTLTPPLTDADVGRRDAFVARLSGAMLGMADVLTTYLGDRLGLYAALDDAGPLTSAELAAHADVHERYAREWLEQQAVGGVLEVLDANVPADARRYALPAAHAEVLLDRDSLNYLAPLTRLFVSLTVPLPRLLQAFQSGGGVGWAEFGVDAREGQADGYRPIYLNLLGQVWLPSIPGLDARLRSEPPARVADFGCGAGWGSIGIARAYPTVLVDGFDNDAASIDLARGHAIEAGLAERVAFHLRDAADPALRGQYDLVTMFEALHDMARPVDALATARRLLAPGGAVLVVDERVAEHFTAPGDDLERLMYAFSVLCCLPAGLAETPSAATGTVMRPDTLRRYAHEAGFRGVDVLPIEHDFFRLYLLSA